MRCTRQDNGPLPPLNSEISPAPPPVAMPPPEPLETTRPACASESPRRSAASAGQRPRLRRAGRLAPTVPPLRGHLSYLVHPHHLCEALRAGAEAEVKRLLHHERVHVNALHRGQTLLEWAVVYSRPEMVRTLLAAGAELENAHGVSGHSGYRHSGSRHAAALSVRVGDGASLLAIMEHVVQEKCGFALPSPLAAAAAQEGMGGFWTQLRLRRQRGLVHRSAQRRDRSLHALDQVFDEAVKMCSHYVHRDIVSLLIAYGVPPSHFQHALWTACRRGHAGDVRELLAIPGVVGTRRFVHQPPHPCDHDKHDWQTLPIHEAAAAGALDCLRALLQENAEAVRDMAIADRGLSMATPLHFAIYYRKFSAIALLVGYGANPVGTVRKYVTFLAVPHVGHTPAQASETKQVVETGHQTALARSQGGCPREQRADARAAVNYLEMLHRYEALKEEKHRRDRGGLALADKPEPKCWSAAKLLREMDAVGSHLNSLQRQIWRNVVGLRRDDPKAQFQSSLTPTIPALPALAGHRARIDILLKRSSVALHRALRH